MLAFMLAVLLAAAPDPTRAALQRVAERSDLARGCSAGEIRSAVVRASIRRLGAVAGREAILAQLEAPCLCGNVNCSWFVVRLDPDRPHLLLQTSAFSVQPIGPANPLPRLRERAHDNALISTEVIYAYRDGRYVPTDSWRVRGDTGARKPSSVPVHFAPGTSSARLRGSVSMGWYDAYRFSAHRGQRLTIDAVRSRVPVRATLFPPHDAASLELRPGIPVTLPASGTFELHIENDSSLGLPAVPYALKLSIR
jgi:hypothetical protein